MSILVQDRFTYTDKHALRYREQRFDEALANRRKRLPKLTTSMCELIGAIRGVCRNPDSEQYEADIEKLADACENWPTIRRCLVASGFSDEEIRDWINAADNKDYIVTDDDFFVSRDDASYCDYSGEQFYQGSTSTVIVRYRHSGDIDTEEWHERNLEHAFYCDISDAWYSRRNFRERETEDGRTICGQVAADHGWWWSDSRDAYIDYDEDEDSDEDGDGDEDDANNEEAEGDPRIPAYHKAYRNWTYTIANRSARGWYGFEIEVGFVDSDDRYNFWDSRLRSSTDFCGEKDGSLKGSGYYGLEIITRPFPLQDLRSDTCKLRLLMKDLNQYEVRGDIPDFGVHITANWGRLDDAHKARLQGVVYAFKPLTIFISGRETSYASFDNSTGHHRAAAERSDDALEIRTFQSTTDYSQLLSYVEYIDALTEWTRDPDRLMHSMSRAAFRRWIRDSGQYPELAKRLFPEPKPKPVTATVEASGPFFTYDITPRAGEYEVCV